MTPPRSSAPAMCAARGATKLVFAHAVAAGDRAAGGIATGAGEPLQLNGATITATDGVLRDLGADGVELHPDRRIALEGRWISRPVRRRVQPHAPGARRHRGSGERRDRLLAGDVGAPGGDRRDAHRPRPHLAQRRRLRRTHRSRDSVAQTRRHRDPARGRVRRARIGPISGARHRVDAPAAGHLSGLGRHADSARLAPQRARRRWPAGRHLRGADEADFPPAHRQPGHRHVHDDGGRRSGRDGFGGPDRHPRGTRERRRSLGLERDL